MLWLKLLVYGPLYIGLFLVAGPWYALRLGGASLVPASPLTIAAGAILVLAGAVLGARCVWDFGKVGRGTPAAFDAPEDHVTVGLYRNVRNPMYVATLLALLGEVVAYLSVWILAYTALIWLCCHLFVVLYEEPTLRSKFGDGYRAYCAAVPRWIPRLRSAMTA